MNAVEIESVVSDLALQPFDGKEFPYAFLTAFGNKETTIKRLRAGATNNSDLGGVLQTKHIHIHIAIAIAKTGEVGKILAALKASPTTTKAKANFILATGRLNRLYVELLKDNPDWGTALRRPDMNHFMARLIFCFFAEDTNIFNGSGLFTATIEQMSARDSSNTHDDAGDSKLKLLNLKKRMARIRVFDPACGSGNFLVIAYKQMREIENAINERRGEIKRKSDIPLTNFRGIELRDFPAEVARLALIIAEYQCDMMYRGQKEALLEFLPLDAKNWITCGNALRLDWLSLCPPTGAGAKLQADDLFGTPLDQTQIDFENEGGETYICGNPPYLGSTWQTAEQKADLEAIFGKRVKNWKSLDYVAGWFVKAADYGTKTKTAAAFVSTNSICQGQQVPILWPLIFQANNQIVFAHTSFKWANLADLYTKMTAEAKAKPTTKTTRGKRA